ncbi:MAG TPA: S8 family serine peptidase [bacterium]|nr:S8 family serine peptidase [bacterium]HPR88963.1 S8 family serine peptidase [bacterium]
MYGCSKWFLREIAVFSLFVPGLVWGRQLAQGSERVWSDRIVIKIKDERVAVDMKPEPLLLQLGAMVRDRGLLRLEKREIKGAQDASPAKAAARMGRVFRGYLSRSADRKQILALLQRNPLIEYAEPLYYHTLDISPNDSLYASQVHLRDCNLAAAWDLVRGSQGDAVLAIVDGGTEIMHQDLRENLWVNSDEVAGNGVDDDANGYTDDLHGWNFANNSGDPTGLATQPDFANHGTHTAGIAAAVTDNRRGVAGAAWNCKVMAIDAADPFGEGIAYGYDGILYAAENGAQIINCSWGRSGTASAYEQDVIDYATSLGAVVVASAGNSGTATVNYPSCYNHVFSIAAVNDFDIKAGFSSYGTGVKVSAPGMLIFSTISANGYARYSGTSMAAPLAAGVIALVRTQHPGWTGFQCAEQVRVTSHPIDDLNSAYAGLLGKGRVDAYAAVTASSPAIRIAAVEFSGTDGDAQFRRGESGRITLTLTNYLAPSSPLTLRLSDNSEFVTLLRDEVTVPGVNTLGSLTQAVPFEFSISEAAPENHVITFSLAILGEGYTDSDHFTLTVAPDFLTLSVNQITTSVAPPGRIGYALPSQAFGGAGFHYRSGANLIYEGSIIAGTSAAQISSSSRSTTTVPDQDFARIAGSPLSLQRPGPLADEESTISMEDRNAGTPMNIAVKQHTLASVASADEDFIIFRFEVTNQGTAALTNFHFGLFFDWDVDEINYDGDQVGYDAERRMGYVYNVAHDPGTYVGCALLSPDGVSFRAILNDERAAGNPGWGIYDGFSDAEKWDAISGGTSLHEAGIGDVSQVLAAGPYQLAPQQSITIDYAVLAGTSLAQLQKHADKAGEFRRRYLLAAPDSSRLHLVQGWNLISSWVAPSDTTLATLLAPVAADLVLFKDGNGNSYWPAYEIDMLHYWDWRKGYWIYLTHASDLILTGKSLSASQASVALHQGWNLVSCLSDSAVSIERAMHGIAAAVTIAKDGAGRVYWPAYHIDTIGTMQPGAGYYIYLTEPATLVWSKRP